MNIDSLRRAVAKGVAELSMLCSYPRTYGAQPAERLSQAHEAKALGAALVAAADVVIEQMRPTPPPEEHHHVHHAPLLPRPGPPAGVGVR